MNVEQLSILQSRIEDKDENEILTLLKYFSIFRHPLNADELHRYSSGSLTELEFQSLLDRMERANLIRQIDGYYLQLQDEDKNIEKRIVGEQKAMSIVTKAKQVGRFIARFPFVKFVGISGSLSKKYADEKTDYDFFIITANNTLWVCRTILHFVKKMSFLMGKQHHLCMNYFIDEHHLQIDEKNIFTRIELSTLIPVHNESVYKTFLLRNQGSLTNIRHLNIDFEGAAIYNPLQKDRENLLWKPLNLFLMGFTNLKWKRKWEKCGYPMENYGLAFKTTPYVSKNHPANYQKKVLEQLQRKGDEIKNII